MGSGSHHGDGFIDNDFVDNMNDEELKHICLDCEEAVVEYSDILDKEMTYCKIPYEQMSRYKEKIFSGGKLIHCPAFKQRATGAEDGGD